MFILKVLAKMLLECPHFTSEVHNISQQSMTLPAEGSVVNDASESWLISQMLYWTFDDHRKPP